MKHVYGIHFYNDYDSSFQFLTTEVPFGTLRKSEISLLVKNHIAKCTILPIYGDIREFLFDDNIIMGNYVKSDSGKHLYFILKRKGDEIISADPLKGIAYPRLNGKLIKLSPFFAEVSIIEIE